MQVEKGPLSPAVQRMVDRAVEAALVKAAPIVAQQRAELDELRKRLDEFYVRDAERQAEMLHPRRGS